MNFKKLIDKEKELNKETEKIYFKKEGKKELFFYFFGTIKKLKKALINLEKKYGEISR